MTREENDNGPTSLILLGTGTPNADNISTQPGVGQRGVGGAARKNPSAGGHPRRANLIEDRIAECHHHRRQA